jgi:hypothetical protein
VTQSTSISKSPLLTVDVPAAMGRAPELAAAAQSSGDTPCTRCADASVLARVV